MSIPVNSAKASSICTDASSSFSITPTLMQPGQAYQRSSDLKKPKSTTGWIYGCDPDNHIAPKNPGVVFGKEGDNLKALLSPQIFTIAKDVVFVNSK